MSINLPLMYTEIDAWKNLPNIVRVKTENARPNGYHLDLVS